MGKRMDRYENSTAKERTEKNKKLYETITDIDVDYIDVNNAIEIKNINNDKLTREEFQQKRELSKIMPESKVEEETYVKEEKVDNRIYDINEILKLARENKLFDNDDKKRLINTEYNILTKLDIAKIDEHKDDSKESLRQLIDTIYGNSEKENHSNDDKDNENDNDLSSDNDGLLDDMKVEETVLSEETSRDILDKGSDDNDRFDDEDSDEEETELDDKDDEEDSHKKDVDNEKENEDEDDNEDDTDEEDDIDEDDDSVYDLDLELKSSKKILILIIIVVILILCAGGYIFYKYFLN